MAAADAKYVSDNAPAATAMPAASALQRAFEQPPDNARIMVRWWWYGPAVTKPMLEQEMQTMKAGGIGGFEVQPTYPLSVDGELPGVHNIKFLSPEFFDMLRFTADKAKELGLRMDLTLGSGWPYGGPMFSKSEGAGEIFEQIARPAAGATSAALPRPLVNGQTLIAAFAVPTGATANLANLKEISVTDGMAQIPSEITGPVEVHFYISGRTGMQVKRPALGAEGNVIDHLSQSVVQKFIAQVAEPEIAACGPNPPHAIFCDSLEVGREDWTDNLLAEFQKRRGYDLRPLLPALFNNSFSQGDGYPPRLGENIDRNVQRQLQQGVSSARQISPFTVSGASLRFAVGSAIQLRGYRSARRRRDHVASVFRDAVCNIRRTFAGCAGCLRRMLHLAALARVSCHSLRHEGRSRFTFSPGRKSNHLSWLAIDRTGCELSRMELLRCRRIQRQKSLVDCDARCLQIPAARQQHVAAGKAR